MQPSNTPDKTQRTTPLARVAAIGLVAALLSACCEDPPPAPAEPPTLLSNLLRTASNPPPAQDAVSGDPGTAKGAGHVAAFSDAALSQEIGRAVVASDGGFGAISIGDNAHATVFIAAIGPDGAKSTAAQITNDIKAPSAELTQTPPAIVEDPQPLFTFKCNEPDCRFECQLDAAPFSPCTSPHTLGAMDKGPHTFRVRAMDAAGNTDPKPQTFEFTADNTPSRVFFSKTPQALMAVDEASFEFECDKPQCLFECRLDARPFEPCVSPFSLGKLGEGEHALEVRTSPHIEGREGLSATFTWQVTTP